jgi:hypothetical protein
MTRSSTAIREFLRPGSIRRPSLPPLEAGLRPNSRLDEAVVVIREDDVEVDDLAPWNGGLVASSGARLLCRGGSGGDHLLASFDGPITALRVVGEQIVAAVEGTGLVTVDASGATHVLCTDELIRRCVTDLSLVGGGSAASGRFIVAVGSSELSASSWSQELVRLRTTGRLVEVRVSGGAGSASTIAEGLAWPSGVADAGDGEYLVSLSLAHRIERRSLNNSTVEPVFENLAGYPGRIREREGGGWWIAMPYLRNRATELVLGDDAMRADMLANVHPEVWLVPQLRSENVYRDPLQIGQQRVMGVIKPWAPPRSYGLAFRMDPDGRVVESVHSRPDGDRKGVTGVAPTKDGVYVSCRGARVVVKISEEQS